MSGVTVGPWHVVPYGDGDSLVICSDEAGEMRIAFMATPGSRDPQERRKTWKKIKANARLIASAPDLLAALELAVSYGWEHESALAAIARARGEV